MSTAIPELILNLWVSCYSGETYFLVRWKLGCGWRLRLLIWDSLPCLVSLLVWLLLEGGLKCRSFSTSVHGCRNTSWTGSCAEEFCSRSRRGCCGLVCSARCGCPANGVRRTESRAVDDRSLPEKVLCLIPIDLSPDGLSLSLLNWKSKFNQLKSVNVFWTMVHLEWRRCMPALKDSLAKSYSGFKMCNSLTKKSY